MLIKRDGCVLGSEMIKKVKEMINHCEKINHFSCRGSAIMDGKETGYLILIDEHYGVFHPIGTKTVFSVNIGPCSDNFMFFGNHHDWKLLKDVWNKRMREKTYMDMGKDKHSAVEKLIITRS